MECCWCGEQWTCSRSRLLPFGNLKSALRHDLQVGIGRRVSICRSSAQLLDCRNQQQPESGVDPVLCRRVLSGWPVRTKPQAPRTLDCAILRQYGPNKFAISALRRKVPTHLLSAGLDSKTYRLTASAANACGFLLTPQHRKRLAQTTRRPCALCARCFRCWLTVIRSEPSTSASVITRRSRNLLSGKRRHRLCN
jgi:hypothetical protein